MFFCLGYLRRLTSTDLTFISSNMSPKSSTIYLPGSRIWILSLEWKLIFPIVSSHSPCSTWISKWQPKARCIICRPLSSQLHKGKKPCDMSWYIMWHIQVRHPCSSIFPSASLIITRIWNLYCSPGKKKTCFQCWLYFPGSILFSRVRVSRVV